MQVSFPQNPRLSCHRTYEPGLGCAVYQLSGLLDRPLKLKEEDKENGLQIQFEIIQVSALKILSEDFPGDAVVNNPPASAEDMGLSPGPGRSNMPRSN